jgi:hypothetical protein
MKSPAEIEIRAADHGDAAAILQCLAAAFAPYRSEYSPAGFVDTVLSPETVHLRLQQMHVLVATVAGNVVGTVSGVCHAGEGHFARNGSFTRVARQGSCREIARRHRKPAGFLRMQADHAGHNLAAQSCHEILREKRVPAFGEDLGFFWYAAARVRKAALTARSVGQTR